MKKTKFNPAHFLVRQHQARSGRTDYTVVTLVSAPLEKAGFVNGFSTRLGGVSAMPKHSLNLSDKKDSKKNFTENTQRFLESLGISDAWLFSAEQIHSDKSVWITKSSMRNRQKPEADALISTLPHVLVGIKIADCLPILLADPKTGVFAVVHAGWRGTLARILEKTVKDLVQKKKVNPKNLIAVLGPVACGDCYELGTDVADLFQKEFSQAKKFLRKRHGKKTYLFDNGTANRIQLLKEGVKKQNIYTLPLCTMHHNQLFFSHRKEYRSGGRAVGRQMAVIGKLKNK